ncbi:MAG TPA: hypothetical protein VJ323_03560 [Bryobacteraceae bacterium]|nr:hypothetical protein [Bryobacteraceae bacterium]
MKPHSLGTVEIGPPPKTAAEIEKEKRFRAARYATFKGEVKPETQVPACRRVKVSDFPAGFLPTKYFEALEQNQKIASCCRHPENHEIEALKSHPDEPAPDIYIFHCTCGRKHRRFCVGLTDTRPTWA